MAVVETARFRRKAHVALFGATSLAAQGVKDLLAARGFPAASLRLFASSTDQGSTLTEFKGEAMLVTEPDIDTLDKLDIAFLCGSPEEGGRYLDWPARAGFVAVDLTGASIQGTAPPVNVSVNPGAIPAGPGVIATPHPIAQLLSTLLAPLGKSCGLREAIAVVLQPASQRGGPGIDELYKQAASLLSFSELPREVFGRQLAFNLIPGFLGEGPHDREAARLLEDQVRRITGGSFALGLQEIQAPVFHGHAVMAHVVLQAGTSADDLAACFEGRDEFRLERDGETATPVERAGEAGILIGGIRPGAGPSSFWIWAICDDLAGGTALNAVRIAELLLERGTAKGRA
jgi:aspartate-semialdehyde dehydrogenase